MSLVGKGDQQKCEPSFSISKLVNKQNSLVWLSMVLWCFLCLEGLLTSISLFDLIKFCLLPNKIDSKIKKRK